MQISSHDTLLCLKNYHCKPATNAEISNAAAAYNNNETDNP